MARRGENIYKRKDGRWEGRYIKGNNNGRAIYGYLYAKSYAEIKQKLFKKQAELMENKHITQSAVSISFEKSAENWLNTMRYQVKESTYTKYRNLVNCYIIRQFQGLPITDITIDLIENLCNNLLINGGIKKQGLSVKTIHDILTVLRRILYYENMPELAKQCTSKKLGIKYTPKRMNILTATEQKKLSEYLMCNLSYRNLGILLCLYTGMRIGEICALKWEDISLSDKTVLIHRTMQRLQIENDSQRKTAVIITDPKSMCSCRIIPLTDDIITLLTRVDIREGYLLSGNAQKYVEPRALQVYFKKILKNIGISQINFHALRHTFATRCVEANFDTKSLSEILGHASVNITLQRYVHPTIELKRKNMEKLSTLFLVNENSQIPKI